MPARCSAQPAISDWVFAGWVRWWCRLDIDPLLPLSAWMLKWNLLMASYKTGILSSIEPRLDRAHHIPYAELSAWHCFLTGRLKTQNTATAATLHYWLLYVLLFSLGESKRREMPFAKQYLLLMASRIIKDAENSNKSWMQPQEKTNDSLKSISGRNNGTNVLNDHNIETRTYFSTAWHLIFCLDSFLQDPNLCRGLQICLVISQLVSKIRGSLQQTEV